MGLLRRREAVAVASLVAAVAAADMAATAPHCSEFLDFCAWNASTSSCTFARSMRFTCGPLPVDAGASNGSAASSASGVDEVGGQDVGQEESPEGVPPSAVDWSCRWNVAGDLSFGPRVVVELDGDNCALEISAGKMVLIESDAVLRASALNIDASFVRIGQRAEISAAYSGQFRNVLGMFTGSAEFGASNGGSGGRRLVLNSTMMTEQTMHGYFDVRPQTATISSDLSIARNAELPTALATDTSLSSTASDADNAQSLRDVLLRNASLAWQLDQFWKSELQSLNELIPPVDVGGERDPSVAAARFLLGSGSIALNGSGYLEAVRGGGRIKIEASKDVVVMDGAVIKANGDNAVEGISGGSGGSVFITAAALSMSGSVEVRGGNAYCTPKAAKNGIHQCYPAGGGGRVQIAYMSSQLDIEAVDTTGGVLEIDHAEKGVTERLAPAQIAALAGATGTYFQVVQRADGKHESQLIIQDKRRHCAHIDCGKDPSRPSVAGAVTSIEVLKNQPNVDLLAVMDGAIISASELRLENGDISITNGSLLVDALFSQPQLTQSKVTPASIPGKLMVRAQDVLVADRSSIILPTGVMEMKARSVAMDASTLLRFEISCYIKTEQYVHLDANISSALSVAEDIAVTGISKSLSLESDGDIVLSGNTIVGGLWASSAQSITISGKIDARNSASIKSTFRRCKQQEWKRLSYDPLSASFANFTILLHARDSIYVGQQTPSQQLRQSLTTNQDQPPPLVERPALVHGGAVLLCATDVIQVSPLSVVSSNGKGELANQGPGSGTCVGSIGGGAGYGGRGADSSSVNTKGDYASGGLSYGTRSGIGMLGSGGGCVSGGNGGGVVMLGATGLLLNGEVHCNGDGGTSGAGGGSGGFLGLSISQYLRGDGRISAVGGGSECTEAVVTIVSQTEAARMLPQPEPEPVQEISSITPTLCGGGGGGGRLQLVGCELSDFDECTRGFEGNYTVAGGATSAWIASTSDASPGAGVNPVSSIPAASSGTFFGFPCPPGSGGLFCRICPVGTYKSESNSEECLPCSNAPINAHYTSAGEINADCDWTCDPGYSGYNCVSPLQQLLEACGGEFGFALVLLSIMTFFILVGYACRSRKEPSYTVRVSKGERQHLLSSAVSQRSRFRSIFRCFYWPRVRYPKLVERDLPEHMARLYLSGSNDSDSPLRLRTTVPPSMKQVLYDEEFQQLAEDINDALSWGSGGACASGGQFLRSIVSVLCYPLTSHVTLLLRHLRVNALKRLVARYNHACMKGPRARWLLNAVKLGYCADYSLVYLELLHKESSQSVCVPTTKIGKPSLPIVLPFAGTGTYFSPFYLDPNDLLVRAIPQCPELTAFIDEPWVEFVAELNELLRVVHRDELVESLVPVARYLERKMSGSSSKLGGLRIYLGRFYVQDEAEIGDEFKLGIFLTTIQEETAMTTGAAGATNDLGMPQPISAGHRRTKSGSSRYYGKDPTGGIGSGYYNPRDPYGNSAGVSSSMDVDRGYKNGSGGNGNPSTSNFGGVDTFPYEMSLWSHGAPRLGRRGSNSNVLATAAGAASAAGAGATSGPSSKASSNASAMSFSRIREEALRVRTSTSGSMDMGNSSSRLMGDSPGLLFSANTKKAKDQARPRRRRKYYEGWQGPVDASLPIPGVLISADELEDRLADRPKKEVIASFLRRHLLPRNVQRSSSLNLLWMLSISLMSLLMVDLAITFAMVVNLKCVTDGEVDQDCSATILIPVLLIPPLALVLSPIMGIISLALSSSTFTRRYAVWNALSMVSVGIAIIACILRSNRLLAPWFAGPLPLLPLIALGIKAGQASIVERYIAFQETHRRRRGWRGLMKRRLSDASIPPESPYASPTTAPPFEMTSPR